MNFSARRRPELTVDVTPLIDIIFQLVIFFMVSTTFVKDMKLELERPNASSSTRASSKSLRVFVDADSNIFIDNLPVKPWMVQSRVREHLQASTSKSILLVVDRRVHAEQLVDVVDQCRLGGATSVGVATEMEAGG